MDRATQKDKIAFLHWDVTVIRLPSSDVQGSDVHGGYNMMNAECKPYLYPKFLFTLPYNRPTCITRRTWWWYLHDTVRSRILVYIRFLSREKKSFHRMQAADRALNFCPTARHYILAD